MAGGRVDRGARRPRPGAQRDPNGRHDRVLRPRPQSGVRTRQPRVHGRDAGDAGPRAHSRSPRPVLRPAQASQAGRELEDGIVGCAHRACRGRRGPRRGSVREGAVARRPARVRKAVRPGIDEGRQAHPGYSRGRRPFVQRPVHLRAAGRAHLGVGRRQLGDRRCAHRTHAEHAHVSGPDGYELDPAADRAGPESGREEAAGVLEEQRGVRRLHPLPHGGGPPGCADCVARGRCLRGRLRGGLQQPHRDHVLPRRGHRCHPGRRARIWRG